MTDEHSIPFDFQANLDKDTIINAIIKLTSYAEGESLNKMQENIISIQSILEQVELNIKFLIEVGRFGTDSGTLGKSIDKLRTAIRIAGKICFAHAGHQRMCA